MHKLYITLSVQQPLFGPQLVQFDSMANEFNSTYPSTSSGRLEIYIRGEWGRCVLTLLTNQMLTLLVDRMEIAGHMILDQLVIWGEANYIHMAQ